MLLEIFFHSVKIAPSNSVKKKKTLLYFLSVKHIITILVQA